MSDEPEPKSFRNRIQKPWLIGGMFAVVGWLLLYSNTALSNLRTLPTEVRKTSGQFASWYYDDDEWNGYWTSEPEAYVDEADMRLSQFPFGLYMQVQDGVIDGMISDKQVCNSVPFDFVLLSGHVDRFGNTATVLAWDTIGGHDVNFAKLKLRIDDGVMTIQPTEGVTGLFPNARIAVDPNVKEWPSEFCTGKEAAEIKMVEQIAKEARAKAPASRQRPPPERARR